MAEKEKTKGAVEPSLAMALSYVNTGKELMKLGEVQLALKTCERGVARCPKASNISIFRGEIYIALFNRDKKPDYARAALASFGQALKLDPNNYLAKLISAQLYLKGGAKNKAKALITSILKVDPSDERAKALMGVVKKIEAAAAKKAAPKGEEKVADEEEEDELVISENLSSSKDDVVVIDSSFEEDDESMNEILSSKLSIFSRMDGVLGIFLVDANGQPFKVLNRAKLDENVIPSLVFNLFKASSNGVRRCGLGTFQRGTLVSPIGTILMANAFYATLAVIIDNDANMQKVETRIQRYLSEVTG